MANTGKEAETEFEGVWKRFGKQAFLHRFMDAAEVVGRTKRVGAIRSQPSDYLVTFRGHTFYAEVKSTEDPTAFRFSLLRKTQSAAATMILAAGGDYVVFVLSKMLGKWFRIPISVIRSATRQSLRWDELGSYEWTNAST